MPFRADTVVESLTVGDPGAERIEIVPDWNGLGDPALVFYDPTGTVVGVLTSMADGIFRLLDPGDGWSMSLTPDGATIAAGGGGGPNGDLLLSAGSTIAFSMVPQLESGTPLVPGRYGLHQGFATDANGRTTFTHDLGTVPAAVICSSAGLDSGGTIVGQVVCQASTWTATQATARLFDHTGAVLASKANNLGMRFSWLVLP